MFSNINEIILKCVLLVLIVGECLQAYYSMELVMPHSLRRTGGQTDGRADERTGGRADGHADGQTIPKSWLGLASLASLRSARSANNMRELCVNYVWAMRTQCVSYIREDVKT